MIVYFAPVLLSIGITALPLLTIEWVGLEKSLYLMYIIEFILSVAVVVFIYRKPWTLGSKGVFIKSLSILFLIQSIICIMRGGSIQSIQISISQAFP